MKCCNALDLDSSNEVKCLSAFFKVINEPNRLKILCILKTGEKCVCEIWQKLGLSQNLTSHHLKKLKDLGLIDSRQAGRKIIYKSNDNLIKKNIKLLNNFLTINL